MDSIYNFGDTGEINNKKVIYIYTEIHMHIQLQDAYHQSVLTPSLLLMTITVNLVYVSL